MFHPNQKNNPVEYFIKIKFFFNSSISLNPHIGIDIVTDICIKTDTDVLSDQVTK